jgi:hypothetical protein
MINDAFLDMSLMASSEAGGGPSFDPSTLTIR